MTGEIQKVIQVETKRTSDFFSTYANNVAIVSNFFDVTFTFGQIESIREGNLIVEQNVRVSVTPSHAKILLGSLIDQIIGYQRQFGEIELPPGVVELSPIALGFFEVIANASKQGSVRYASPEDASAEAAEDLRNKGQAGEPGADNPT